MMMAAVYKDNSVIIYRDGEVYASYTIEKPFDFLNSLYLQLVIGSVNLNLNYATSFIGGGAGTVPWAAAVVVRAV